MSDHKTVEELLVMGFINAINTAQDELDMIHEERLHMAEESFLELFTHVNNSPFSHLVEPFHVTYEAIMNARLRRMSTL